MSETKKVTFEDGYRRLQEIADEVNKAEVPVDRMADLFAEGKGLDKALTDHLTEQKTRIESIERGEGVLEFEIVPQDGNSPGEAAAPPPAASASDFQQAQPKSEDDIPF